MKLPSLRNLSEHITAERLAVAVFLAVAFGLWWGMQSRPERVIGFRMDNPSLRCDLFPAVTLYLVEDYQGEGSGRDIVRG